MFGISQYDNVSLRPDMAAYLGNLHLLRALAKLKSGITSDSADEIESVALTRHITRAVPMPKGVTHQNHYVKNDYQKDYVLYPRFPQAPDSIPIQMKVPSRFRW